MDPDSRQNAYYGIGLLVYEVGQTAVMNYPEILKAVMNYPEILKALLKACGREQTGSARDNISEALARMIVANLKSVPLDLLLPRLMSSLPLTVDFSESEIVLEAFRMLYDDAHSSVIRYIEHMLLTSIQMLHKNHLAEPECKKDEEAFVKEIEQTYPEKFNKVSRENPEVNDYMRSIPYLIDEDQL